jgi:hypothetical protein
MGEGQMSSWCGKLLAQILSAAMSCIVICRTWVSQKTNPQCLHVPTPYRTTQNISQPHQTRNNFVVPLTFWGHGLRKKIRGPLINLFSIRPDYQLLCFTVHFMRDLGSALKPYMPMESTCKHFSFSKRVIPLGL